MPRITPRPKSAPGPQAEDDRLKSELSTRYDQLNDLWKRAEDLLRQYMVPAEVEYIYSSYVDHEDPDDMAHGAQTYHSIGWARAKGSWRICVGLAHDAHSPTTMWTPITEASLDLRKECVKHFPKLKEKVIERAKNLIPELDTAIASLSEALN